MNFFEHNQPLFTVYIAGSFKHKHGVRLFGGTLCSLGCHVLDWTEKASPPPGMTPADRRIWMDTDQDGGQVYAFCHMACQNSDIVIYYGASGQDAGVEVGLAAAFGVPVLGIRGPLEAPGLMLHGSVNVWVDEVERAIAIMEKLVGYRRNDWSGLEHEKDDDVRKLALLLRCHQPARP